MHPVLLQIGSFELASYGFMTALGYLVAAAYLLPHLKKVHLDKETFWDLIFTAFMGALVGSKLLYLILSWDHLGADFSSKIVNAVKNVRYGFVFYGGAITAVASLIIYMRRKKIPVLSTGDFLITALPLGHALGRVGCFLAGCCYGAPTTMPWGIRFTHPSSLVPPEWIGIPLHPTQLYEAAGNLLIFALLHILYKRPHKNGAVLAAYAALYAVMRFVIEFFRGDFRGDFLWGMSPSQWIALFAAATGTVLFCFLRKDKNHA